MSLLLADAEVRILDVGGHEHGVIQTDRIIERGGVFGAKLLET